MALIERPVRPWVKITNVDIEPVHIESIVVHIEPMVAHIEPMAMHIEATAGPTMTALVTQCSEPLVVPTRVALDMQHSEPLVVPTTTPLDIPHFEPLVATTPISTASIDILSVLALLASYFMSGREQLKVVLIELPMMTESLVAVIEVGPLKPVEALSSPDSKDSAELDIQILAESLMKLFNQSVKSVLTTGNA